MNSLIRVVNNLKNSEIGEKVNLKMRDFLKMKTKDSDEIFKELCFCILTANFSAKKGISIQEKIGEGFLHFSKKELSKKLSEQGHRFPNKRAEYILEARKRKDLIKEILNKTGDEFEIRKWVVDNIKGIGMKEASHFLRNMGYKDMAIIDFHILDVLVKEEIIERPRTLTPRVYIRIEKILRELSQKTGLSLGELDLYLWYTETGEILK